MLCPPHPYLTAAGVLTHTQGTAGALVESQVDLEAQAADDSVQARDEVEHLLLSGGFLACGSDGIVPAWSWNSVRREAGL